MEVPQRRDLAAELIRREEIDQDARGFAIRGEQPTAEDGERMIEVDADNTAWLDSVVTEHGWPGVRLVGEEASRAAWLLAQHADRRPELQRRWLVLLRAAVAAGDASPRNLAYLEDRVATAERRPQRHGTQWWGIRGGKLALAPLEDPKRVNEYRAAAELDPLSDEDITGAWPDYSAFGS